MFVGAGFFVAGASQFTPGTVRVIYSSTPKATNPAQSNDALNPTNYVLSGPGPYSIVSVQPVSGNPLAIDIVLGAPLLVGTWTVAVSNVQTPALNSLTAPTSAQFQVTSAASLTPLAGGAENDDPEKIIRKHLNPALHGPNWDALIKALSTGDDKNWENARLAFDQLYLSTASGSYLERRASDQGVRKPVNVGIPDDLFRQLAIKTTAKKVVHEAIREILEIYYGQDSLRAFVECTVDENYNLTGSPTLTWILDEKEEFSHTFVSTEFGSVAAAKAQEVAYALTKAMRDLGSKGFAISYRSPVTGLNRVRIYSGSLGLGSFARVTGGNAQNILKFPTEIITYSGTITTGSAYTWVYSQPDQNTTRASLTKTGAGILMDISSVHEGDYVIIGDDALIGTTGTFEIKAVSLSWTGPNLTQTFDIEKIAFTGSATMASNSAYRFYRPTKNSIAAAAGRTVVVAQTQPGIVDISIPATTQAVVRGPKHAAYARVQPALDISRLQRLPSGLVNVFTKSGHGYTVADIGKQIQLDNIKPASSRPFVTPSNGSTFPSTWLYAASHISLSAQTQVPSSLTTENGSATVLTNGQVLFAGGYRIVGGSYDGAKVHTNRYQSGSTGLIIDGTEADGATQHSHTWVGTSDLNNARQYHAASTFGTGAIVSGGLRLTPYTILNGAEQYQLGGLWINLPNMGSARSGHQQVELNDGSVFVMGGATTEGTALRSTEFFISGAWTPGPNMTLPRTDFSAVKLSDGRVFVSGGRTMGRGHDADDNTLALWRLDESAGPTAADAKGSYPLTHTGSTLVSVQGKINNCIDFNAANSHLTGAGNGAAISALLGEWTLECWFKRTTLGNPTEFASYTGSTEVANDNQLMGVGIDTSNRIFWKWENGAGVDVTATMTLPLASLPAYRASFFNHLAVVKSLNGMAYSGKTLGWAVGNLIHGQTSGARAFITSVDGGVPGGASGTIRLQTANHKNFTVGENLVRIPINQMVIDTSLLPTAAVAGASLYDVTIYINGIAYQTWTGQTNATGGSAAAWYVARDPKVSGSGFQGFLDDVRVSKRARSADEIRTDFIAGWGNHQSPHGDQAIGAVTGECEIYNAGTWTRIAQMNLARAHHRAIVLPGDYVLVTGGIGYDPAILPGYNDADASIWPSQSLREAEIYNPTTGRWSFLQPAGIRRHGHVATYISGTNQVVLAGGRSSLQNGFGGDDTGWVDILDLTTRTWKTAPSKLVDNRRVVTGALGGSEIVLMGGNDGTVTNASAEAFILGGQAVSSGGLNSQFRITGVPNGNQLQVQSTTVSEQQQYTSTMGATYQGQVATGSFWNISTGSRTSNITTLVLSFPSGITGHSIQVGDYVYVNSRTSQFGAGLKLVTAVTDTSISYGETASNQVSISVVGSVSENQADDPEAVPVSAPAALVNDPGPVVFDPLEGLAVTSTEGVTTSFPLYANQQYEEVEITGGDNFPDGPSWIALGFGHSTQTVPIKVLGKYKNGPTTTRLILNYSYKFVSDFPIGTTVTLLAQKEAFVPTNPEDAGSFYVTASSAGRVAAQAAAEEALAAGIDPDVTIVYPGDRGLGGEGLPAAGTQKLSDKVAVFAGDEIDEEVQLRREE